MNNPGPRAVKITTQINWPPLNSGLIPSARRRVAWQEAWPPSTRIGKAIWRFYGAFTREGRLVFVACLLTGAFGVDVAHTQVYVLFCILAGLLFASLVVSRVLRVPEITVRVHAPPRVYVGDEVVFAIECQRREAGPPVAPLRIEGPFLPYFGRWMARPRTLDEVGYQEGARTEARARFSERGDLTLGTFRASAIVPLGLAAGPYVESAKVRLRVVPRPANVVRLATPMAQKHQPGGVALASKTGESMDLLGVRPYRPGDRIRDLSARTWARTGTPAVREYQEEYFTRIGVVLDCGAAGEATYEAAVSLVAGIVAHLGRGEALIDLLVNGPTIHTLTLGRSLGFLDQALDFLAVAERAKDLDRAKLLTDLGPHLAQLSCVVLVVDGWDASREELVRGVERFGVRVVRVGVGVDVPLGTKVPVATLQAGEPVAL